MGHVAFSHLFDTLINRLYEKKESSSLATTHPHLQTHEQRSVTLLCQLNETHTLGFSQEELKLMEAMILGSKPLKGYPPWMFCIVSSFVDCDRLDYLLRDSYFTGVPAGFRLQRILSHSRIMEGELRFHVKVRNDILQVAQS